MSNDAPEAGQPVEAWQAYGLRCSITFGLLCFNGYVRIPGNLYSPEAADRVLQASGGITYGPDDEGWVGFDTGHAGDYWAPDDLASYISPQVLELANTMRGIAERYPGGHRWTLDDLREAVEDLAQQVAVALDLRDVVQADSPDELAKALRNADTSE